MKKNIILIVLVLFLFTLAGCANKTQAPATNTPTTVITTTDQGTVAPTTTVITTTETAWVYKVNEYPLLDYNEEYNLKETKLNGYYFNSNMQAGNESLLYVDFDEFLKAMDGFLVYEEYKFIREDDKYQVYITYEDEDTGETEDCYLIIDLVNKTIALDLYFIYNTPEMEETDYSYGLNVNDEKSYSNDVIRANYTFDGYGVDFFKYEEKYYVPYWVANLFLCTFDYCNVFFNEDEFIFVYCDLSELTDEQRAEVYDGTMYYKEPSEEDRFNQYNQLRFIFNQIFGVREDENFEDLDKKLRRSTKVALKSTDPEANAQGYKYLCYMDLNDLHTYAIHPSFYLGSEGEFQLYTQDVNQYFLNNYYLYSDLAQAKSDALDAEGIYDDTLRFYEDTAIITLAGFQTAATDDIFNEDGSVKETAKDVDSFYFMKDCLKKIEDHGGIKNVVVDTTLNGGGNVGAMLRVLGFFIEDIYVEDYYKNFGLKVSTCYNVDTNLDDVVDENDLYDQYTWYCLSSGYSYSAANSFAIICKSCGVKVMGQKTGGGMCSILPLCLIDGTSIYTSGYNCSTYYIGRADGEYEFVDVQYGIDPDIELTIEQMYKSEEIYKAIHPTTD